MKLATVTMLAAFVGCLGAQTSSQSETKTTTTTTTVQADNGQVNMEGTLVDQGCYTTHSHSRETTSDPNSTTTTTTTKDSSDCPVTTSTKTFGLLTPDGKMVRFDDAGNGRVVEMMKSDRDFSNDMNAHRPVKVRVVATPNGDVMVIKDIKPYRQ
jgi:hypothetical protein